MNDPETVDEGFDDGFNDVSTATPTQEPEPEKTEQPAPIEYAQLTKAQFDDLMARAALVDEIKATQEKSFGTAFGKIGGIERTLKQLETGSQIDIDQADIDALKEDFPPLARALEKVKSLKGIPMAGGLDESRLDEALQQRIAPVVQKFEKRLLAKEHPDWEAVDQDPEFAKFVASQPQDWQTRLVKASNEFDSEVVSKAMSDFKASRKKPEPTPAVDPAAARRSRMSAAVTPRGSGGTPASNPDDDFNAGFRDG